MRESVEEKKRKGMLIGHLDEQLVMDLLSTQCGGKCEKSTRREDIYDHIDIWWNSPRRGRLGIEVKGVKKNYQRGKRDDTIQWIELVGVTGHPGWIYGKAEYIAFLTLSKVIFVKRDRLAEWAEQMTEGKETVYKTPTECYIPYCRDKVTEVERKDKVFKAKMSDIEALKHFEIEYTEDLFPRWYFEERFN